MGFTRKGMIEIIRRKKYIVNCCGINVSECLKSIWKEFIICDNISKVIISLIQNYIKYMLCLLFFIVILVVVSTFSAPRTKVQTRIMQLKPYVASVLIC